MALKKKKLSKKKLPKNKLPKNKLPKNKLPKNKLPKNKLPKNKLPKKNTGKKRRYRKRRQPKIIVWPDVGFEYSDSDYEELVERGSTRRYPKPPLKGEEWVPYVNFELLKFHWNKERTSSVHTIASSEWLPVTHASEVFPGWKTTVRKDDPPVKIDPSKIINTGEPHYQTPMEYLYELAIPRALPKQTVQPRSPVWPVSPAAMNAIPSPRIEKLATPKRDLSVPHKKDFWNFVKLDAYRCTKRNKFLAEPKKQHPDTPEPFPFPRPITRAALRAVASPRITELAKPKLPYKPPPPEQKIGKRKEKVRSNSLSEPPPIVEEIPPPVPEEIPKPKRGKRRKRKREKSSKQQSEDAKPKSEDAKPKSEDDKLKPKEKPSSESPEKPRSKFQFPEKRLERISEVSHQ